MQRRTIRKRLTPVLTVALLLGTLPALAQTGATPSDVNLRFFQQFFTDAAITSQWWEAQLRIQQGSVPPVQDADGFAIGPVIAVSPWRDVELGGQVFYVDYDPDNRAFESESGVGDVDVFGKYRIMTDPLQLTFGASLTLPTGSEDDGLGTGELVPAVFAAVRGDLGDIVGVAHLGLRFNKDAEILDEQLDLDSKTSTFLGGGLIFPTSDSFSWSVEATVESKRFKDPRFKPKGSSSSRSVELDADIRLTGGVHWTFSRHNMLRGAAGVGLADGAPDLELIGSYVYSF
jgi:hypothetical protein